MTENERIEAKGLVIVLRATLSDHGHLIPLLDRLAELLAVEPAKSPPDPAKDPCPDGEDPPEYKPGDPNWTAGALASEPAKRSRRKTPHAGSWKRLETGEYGAWVKAPGFQVHPGDVVQIRNKKGALTCRTVRERILDKGKVTLVTLFLA